MRRNKKVLQKAQREGSADWDVNEQKAKQMKAVLSR